MYVFNNPFSFFLNRELFSEAIETCSLHGTVDEKNNCWNLKIPDNYIFANFREFPVTNATK